MWAKWTSFFCFVFFCLFFFLHESLRTRMNYFSAIDQNKQINCLLHFHSCFTFEFSHSAVMIFYQNCSLVHQFQEAWFSLKISRHLVFILIQKSSSAWNTDTTMSRKLNWIIKKIILYICIAGLSSKTPTGRENCSLISMILSNFPRNVNSCYCCWNKVSNVAQQLCRQNVRNEAIHLVNYRL